MSDRIFESHHLSRLSHGDAGPGSIHQVGDAWRAEVPSAGLLQELSELLRIGGSDRRSSRILCQESQASAPAEVAEQAGQLREG